MFIWNRIRLFIKSPPYKFKRTKISLVHDNDLRQLITSLGIADDIDRGKLCCECCGKPIDFDNLWGILHREGTIILICSNPECLSKIY